MAHLNPLRNVSKPLILIGLGAAAELLFAAFLVFQQPRETIDIYMIVYAITFLLMLAGYFLIRNEESGKLIKIVFVFGLLFRATLIPTEISTSDDVYRYIWEGKVIANGYNPFEYAPNSDELKHLASERLPEEVAFNHMTTIYPPVAQAVFVAGYLISGENAIGLKIIYLLAELLTFIFLLKLFEVRGMNRNYFILYAWLPLPIMEYFINAHVDVVGIAFFVMFLYFMQKNNYLVAAIPFAFGFLTKLYLLIVAPLLLRELRLKRTFYFYLIITAITILLFLPLIPQERSVNESLFTYLSHWTFNGSVYYLFNLIFNDNYIARSICLILFVAIAGNIALRYDDFLKGVYGVWICFILFMPTLYPWYLGWAAAVNPFFAFSSVTSLFFTVNVTNFTPMGEVWKEYWWAYLIQYVPFYILLAKEFTDVLKGRR